MAQENLQERISKISDNLKSVRLKIASAAEKSGRFIDEIKLVAVTKLLPIELVRGGIDAGLTCFGENYPEQAVEKIQALKTEQNIEWHMIGHIQSRKTRIVCEYFDMVHSVDRLKVARYLGQYSRELEKVLPVLIEVNLTGEESKFGFPAYNERDWGSLASQLDLINQYKNLNIRGLMTMPPLYDDPEQSRPVYKKLKRLQSFLQDQMPEISWHELSIGTSFDYEVAIQEGATIVRIGTDIFGKRSYI